MPDVTPEATLGQLQLARALQHAYRMGTAEALGVELPPMDAGAEIHGPDGAEVLAEGWLAVARAAEDAANRAGLARVLAGCARYKAERDDYAARLKATDQSWAAVAAQRDKLAAALDAAHRQVERREAERDKLDADCTLLTATLTRLGNSHADKRKALEHALHVLEEHDEPDDDARSRALAIISAELAGDGA